MNFKYSRWLLSVMALFGGVALVGGAIWFASAQDSTNTSNVSEVTNTQAQSDPVEANATPMAQRVATIAFLNKRNNLVREFQMKPGDSLKVADDLILRLRACDTTAPWEPDPATGAFVQVDLQSGKKGWSRIFSGWLYKEQPALNVVQNPIYDVWVKACKMSHGEPADEHTLVNADSGAAEANQASSAKKSGGHADESVPTAPKPAAPATPAPARAPAAPPPEEQMQDDTALDNSTQ